MLSETEGTGHDFPFVSLESTSSAAPGEDDMTTPEQELAPASRLRVWKEDLYKANPSGGVVPDGGVIGSVAIAHGRGRGRLPFVAVFTFDDGDDTVVVRGDVPRERGDWRGDGTVHVIDGTGRFDGRTDSIPLHSENPKRWG